MATTDINFDPALHANEESDARQVLDLVLHQQIGTFSAVEIAQVAELLPSSWISRNIVALTNAARLDDNGDWYFPVYTRKANPASHTRPTSSSWSGVHHLAADQASAKVQRLPPLPEMPPSWRISTIVASAGGLLLHMPPIHPIASSGNKEVPVRPCRSCGSVGIRHARECWMNSNDWRRAKSRLRSVESKFAQDWKPLLVCNPLTKTWRELPPPVENSNAGGSLMKWRYDEVLIDMIVDDDGQQANSYTIVMTFRNSFCMCVYTSTSNAWVCHRYMPPASLALERMSHTSASAVVRGRLHYAFLDYRLDAPTLATLCVFEIQPETGEWKPWNEYTLEVMTWSISTMRLRSEGRIAQREASAALRGLALVECMGEMYAVIPTRLDEITICDDNYDHVIALVDMIRNYNDRLTSEAMPVLFHIVGLNRGNPWNDLKPCALQIQVPHGRSNCHLRRMSISEKMSSEFWDWFSCTARGSVIWVTCEDYLLQYDVVSGESKTQIIRKPRLAVTEVSYSPSFHMKP